MELDIKNDEFILYVKRHGGVISIGDFYQIKGCCNAVKMPSGRLVSPNEMFNPQKKERYFFFHKKGIDVYIEKTLIADKNEVEFLIISTARYKIVKEKNKLLIL